MKQSYTYIITNKPNGTLYVGVTNDINRRIFEHKNKLIPGFSSKYELDRLVYLQQFGAINDAIVAEKKIKGWTRRRKLELIEGTNPSWNDLGLDPS